MMSFLPGLTGGQRFRSHLPYFAILETWTCGPKLIFMADTQGLSRRYSAMQYEK